MDGYIEKHLLTEGYIKSGAFCYTHPMGWQDVRIGKHIILAHRKTYYTVEAFDDFLHAHDYCEIVFWHDGDVQYVSRDRVAAPTEGAVVMIPPRTEHTTRLLSASEYERTVLYVAPDALHEFSPALSSFFSSDSDAFFLVLSAQEARRAKELLVSAIKSAEEGNAFGAYVAVLDALLLVRRALDGGDGEVREESYLPKPVREIRRYIETSYATIESVEAIATEFFYSREYVTRLFRKYYNLSPGQYLEQCRIKAAAVRMEAGERVADACFAVGYKSVSAFCAAFRRVMGCAPSSFRLNPSK